MVTAIWAAAAGDTIMAGAADAAIIMAGRATVITAAGNPLGGQRKPALPACFFLFGAVSVQPNGLTSICAEAARSVSEVY